MRTSRTTRTVLVLGVTTALLSACSRADELPEITFYADGHTVVQGPLRYCDLEFLDCVDGAIGDLAVPPGYPLQISVPSEVADAPWRLITVYGAADGTVQTQDQYFRSGERLAVTVRLDDPQAQLLGVEIQLPSGATDDAGNPFSRATWSLRTDPEQVGS